MNNGITWWIQAFIKSAKQFYTGRYSKQCSALAYTTLLTLVPIFTIAVYIFASLPSFNALFESFKHYIFLNFLPASSSIIESKLNEFTKHASKLPITSLTFLAVSTLLLVVQVKNTINAIWGSPKYSKISASITHFIVIVAMPIFIGLGVYISNYVFSSIWTDKTSGMVGLNLIPVVFSIFINSFTFCLLYTLTPSRHVNIMNGLFGGVIAAILFEGAKNGFVLYIRLFPTYELIYGALATIPIFLIWLYITWSIIIFGAILSKNYDRPV